MQILEGNLEGKGLKFGLVVARFNDLFTAKLLDGAHDCLIRHGVKEDDITVAWVPGSFEIPTVLKHLAAQKKFNALVALGCVIQGATGHADIITQQVARCCAQLSLEYGLPVIDGVIGAQTIEQAMERSGAKQGNRGWSAAQTALEMANLVKKIG